MNLVERLRARNERFQAMHGNYLYYAGVDGILDCEAADRIGQLEAALREYLRDFGDNEDSDSQRMADKARAALEGKP